MKLFFAGSRKEPSEPMSLPSTNKATTTKSANNIVNIKVGDHKKKVHPTVDYMLDPCIDLKYNSSHTQLEQFAMGQVLQIVNIKVNKMISAQAMLENYNSSVCCLKQYHLILKDSNADNKKAVLPQPITVQLNNHNINNAIKVLFKVT